MSQPEDLPAWATDDNYQAGADSWSATPTKVEPAAGLKASGFVPNSEAIAQYVNWVLANHGDWLSHLALMHARNWSVLGLAGAPASSDFRAIVTNPAGVTVAAGGISTGFDACLFEFSSPFTQIDRTASLVAGPGPATAVVFDAVNGVWILGQLGSASAAGGIQTAPEGDLSTWTARGAVKLNVGAMATDGGTTLAIGADDDTLAVEVWRATDGITWAQTGGAPTTVQACKGIAYNGSKWVAVFAGGEIHYSDTGDAWTKVDPAPTANDFAGITYDESRGLFLAVTATELLYSPDGGTWTLVASCFPLAGAPAQDIRTHKGLVVVAGGGAVYVTVDPTVAEWNHSRFPPGSLVAVSYDPIEGRWMGAGSSTDAELFFSLAV